MALGMMLKKLRSILMAGAECFCERISRKMCILIVLSGENNIKRRLAVD